MLRSSAHIGSSSSGTAASLSSYDCLRILVLGDSGVGKSSLVHILCHGSVLTNPTWTIGASVEVKLHFYKEGSDLHQESSEQQKPVIIEFFDIGGSLQHKTSRHIFYQNFHGVMFVHDLTNKKSLRNLLKWNEELVYRDQENPGGPISYESIMRGYTDYRTDRYLSVPVLVVGTKADMMPSPARLDRVTTIGKDLGACDTIKLNCLNPSTVQPGTSCAVTLSKFYDKVIENSTSSKLNNSYSGSNYASSDINSASRVTSGGVGSGKLSSSANYSKLSSGNLTRIHIE
ncbi:rab-like protein 3 [Convolutriloba macropyga]|uniref:rab-like protein 3 n=1 Tax=Convolutriloba macropyga TaxID=536237 RepID=UPI003F51D7E5